MLAHGPQGDVIGRAATLARVTTALRDGAREVVLHGPPGVGKSRVARLVAEDAPTLGCRHVWCSLACATTASDIGERVRGALAVSDGLVRPPGATSAEWLGAFGPLLLVLDGFEEGQAAARDALEQWLDGAPELRVVVTSRARFDARPWLVQEEITPLAVPRPDAPAETSDAFRLFVLRAREAGGLATPNERDAPAIAEIVQLLDGIPLAIELAAAQTAVLSPEQILARLRRAPDSTFPYGAMALSWERLSAGERAALAQLAVFPESFEVDAVERVVTLPRDEGASVIDVLLSLRRASLIAGARAERAVRLELYGFVRRFAAAQLDAAERARVERRYVDHYLEVGARLERLPHGDAAWTDLGHVVHALGLGLGGDPTTAARATRLLGEIAHVLVHLMAPDRFRALVDRAVLVAPTLGPAEQALTLLAQGLARPAMSVAAMVDWTEAAVHAHAASDDRVLARVLYYRGRLAARQSPQAAIELLAEAAERFARVGDRYWLATTLFQSGVAHLYQGTIAEAITHERRALAILDDIGDQRSPARFWAELTLAYLLWHEAQHEAAWAYAESARGLARQVAVSFGEPFALTLMAAVQQSLGNLDDAGALTIEAEERAQRAGSFTRDPEFLLVLIGVALARGDGARAGRLAQAGEVHHGAHPSYGRGLAAVHAIAHALRMDLVGAEASLRQSEGAVPSPIGELVRVAPLYVAAARAEAHATVDVAELLATARAFAPRAPVARMLLASLLPRLEALSAARVEAARGPVDLVVDRARQVVRLADGRALALAGHEVKWRLVDALVAHHVAQRGTPTSDEDLIEAAWPGERMDHLSALNRLRVAMSSVRKLGLVVERRDGGYLLSSHIEVSCE